MKDIEGLKCKVSILTEHDSKIAGTEVALPDCQYYKNCSGEMSLQVPRDLPADKADYTLRLELYSDNRKISQNEYEIILAK